MKINILLKVILFLLICTFIFFALSTIIPVFQTLASIAIVGAAIILLIYLFLRFFMK